jgi:CheY-like chemotaxis protein
MTHRVLIVDDDPVLRAVLDAFLQTAGYVTRCAHNGNEALNLLASEQFDVMLTDKKMPGMDGHQLLDAIGDRFPRMGAVMMTAFGSDDSEVRARSQRVRFYIEKPIFDLERIREAVELALVKTSPQ